MPWTPQEFLERHNHGLSPAQASHAARQANAILRSGAPEGIAIATANKYAQHHRDAGGFMPGQGGGIGGATPAQTGSNPMMMNLIQRFAGLPNEKLAELATQMRGSPQGQVIQQLLAQRRMQPQNAPQPQQSPQQPVAQSAAPVQQAGGGATPGRAPGGDMGMSPSQATPWWSRADARMDTSEPSLGFLHGPTPGRADALDTTAPAGAHVIPADIVSGLGQGNSLAGAGRMEQIISTGPGGMPLPRGAHGRGPPRPPSPMREAKGGDVPKKEPENTPVLLSHGEYVVSPDDVLRWGRGDHKAGHAAFDAWIVAERARQIKKLKSLPGPVKT